MPFNFNKKFKRFASNNFDLTEMWHAALKRTLGAFWVLRIPAETVWP